MLEVAPPPPPPSLSPDSRWAQPRPPPVVGSSKLRDYTRGAAIVGVPQQSVLSARRAEAAELGGEAGVYHSTPPNSARERIARQDVKGPRTRSVDARAPPPRGGPGGSISASPRLPKDKLPIAGSDSFLRLLVDSGTGVLEHSVLAKLESEAASSRRMVEVVRLLRTIGSSVEQHRGGASDGAAGPAREGDGAGGAASPVAESSPTEAMDIPQMAAQVAYLEKKIARLREKVKRRVKEAAVAPVGGVPKPADLATASVEELASEASALRSERARLEAAQAAVTPVASPSKGKPGKEKAPRPEEKAEAEEARRQLEGLQAQVRELAPQAEAARTSAVQARSVAEKAEARLRAAVVEREAERVRLEAEQDLLRRRVVEQAAKLEEARLHVAQSRDIAEELKAKIAEVEQAIAEKESMQTAVVPIGPRAGSPSGATAKGHQPVSRLEEEAAQLRALEAKVAQARREATDAGVRRSRELAQAAARRVEERKAEGSSPVVVSSPAVAARAELQRVMEAMHEEVQREHVEGQARIKPLAAEVARLEQELLRAKEEKKKLLLPREQPRASAATRDLTPVVAPMAAAAPGAAPSQPHRRRWLTSAEEALVSCARSAALKKMGKGLVQRRALEDVVMFDDRFFILTVDVEAGSSTTRVRLQEPATCRSFEAVLLGHGQAQRLRAFAQAHDFGDISLLLAVEDITEPAGLVVRVARGLPHKPLAWRDPQQRVFWLARAGADDRGLLALAEVCSPGGLPGPTVSMVPSQHRQQLLDFVRHALPAISELASGTSGGSGPAKVGAAQAEYGREGERGGLVLRDPSVPRPMHDAVAATVAAQLLEASAHSRGRPVLRVGRRLPAPDGATALCVVTVREHSEPYHHFVITAFETETCQQWALLLTSLDVFRALEIRVAAEGRDPTARRSLARKLVDHCEVVRDSAGHLALALASVSDAPSPQRIGASGEGIAVAGERGLGGSGLSPTLVAQQLPQEQAAQYVADERRFCVLRAPRKIGAWPCEVYIFDEPDAPEAAFHINNFLVIAKDTTRDIFFSMRLQDKSLEHSLTNKEEHLLEPEYRVELLERVLCSLDLCTLPTAGGSAERLLMQSFRTCEVPALLPDATGTLRPVALQALTYDGGPAGGDGSPGVEYGPVRSFLALEAPPPPGAPAAHGEAVGGEAPVAAAASRGLPALLEEAAAEEEAAPTKGVLANLALEPLLQELKVVLRSEDDEGEPEPAAVPVTSAPLAAECSEDRLLAKGERHGATAASASSSASSPLPAGQQHVFVEVFDASDCREALFHSTNLCIRVTCPDTGRSATRKLHEDELEPWLAEAGGEHLLCASREGDLVDLLLLHVSLNELVGAKGAAKYTVALDRLNQDTFAVGRFAAGLLESAGVQGEVAVG